jgi:predicted nucleic acid-binding protein
VGFLIDTNVLSELRKGDRTDAGVRQWFSGTDASELFVSVLTLGEIRRGIEGLRRRDPVSAQHLEVWFAGVQSRHAARILPVTVAVAETWGRLGIPDPIPVVDGLLAATALEYGLTLVTRNVEDMKRTGVGLLNPFTGKASCKS